MPDVFPCRNLGFPWRRSWGKFQNLVMLQRFPAAVGCGCSGGCVRSLEYFGPAKVACRCEILALDQMQHTMEIIPVWKITELQFHSFYSLLLFCFFSFFQWGFYSLFIVHGHDQPFPMGLSLCMVSPCHCPICSKGTFPGNSRHLHFGNFSAEKTIASVCSFVEYAYFHLHSLSHWNRGTILLLLPMDSRVFPTLQQEVGERH